MAGEMKTQRPTGAWVVLQLLLSLCLSPDAGAQDDSISTLSSVK